MNKVFDKSTGYHYVWCPEHPNAKHNGNVAYHRYVMSKFLNRALKRNEHIHHIDGNKLNNKIGNLELVNCSEHIYKHLHKYKERKILKKCLVCEKMTYNLKYCSKKCYDIWQRKISKRPSKKELKKLLKKYTYIKISEMFKVSDRTVSNWSNKRG